MANIKSAKKRVLTSQIRAERRLTLLLLQAIRLLLKLHYQLLSAKFLRLLLRVSTTRTQLQERFPALQKL